MPHPEVQSSVDARVLSYRQRPEAGYSCFLNTPSHIQAKTNYGNGQISKYDELKKIISRTKTILNCPGLNINSFEFKESVEFFCKKQVQNFTGVEGEVEEYNVCQPKL